jgi:hypothetical protein
LIETPEISVQWFGLANYRMMTGKGLREAFEASIHINVIDNDRAAGSQSSPRQIHLKANVAFIVQAVMNEKIDLAELRKHARQAAPARTTDVGPSMLKSVINRNANLFVPRTIAWWAINTPEMATPISLKCLKNKP